MPPKPQNEPETLCIAVGQSDFVVGDLEGNAKKILELRKSAPQADLLLTPELSLCGYLPEDLLLRKDFLDACERTLDQLQEHIDKTPGADILLGAPWRCPQLKFSEPALYNSIFLLKKGERQRLDKCFLPNYGVFDEKRYFRAAESSNPPLRFKGKRLGVLICEDAWTPEGALSLKQQGADILISLSASPFEQGKAERRQAMAHARCEETQLPFLFVNTVGGQDELLFDGGSFALNPQQQPMQMPFFSEKLACFRWKGSQLSPTNPLAKLPPSCSQALLYRAMTKGLADYTSKNGFTRVVLGLSGGIDSALCALIAVEAMGANAVSALFLPSPYTSPQSREDASALADALDIPLKTIDISATLQCLAKSYEKGVGDKLQGVAAENIQARLRGAILMAASNSTGAMLLATGNKSEFATGYATLYGDMCGGYAPLKDLYKSEVYAVARWLNKTKTPPLLPPRILSKAPSAELRHHQRDDQTLPTYEKLDPILFKLLEKAQPADQQGLLGSSIEAMLLAAEHKRRQAPPGPKLGTCAFGRERRYPISHRFSPPSLSSR